MKKLIACLLGSLAIIAGASPAKQERHDFCYATATVAYEVATLKEAGLTREMFEHQLANLISAIKDQFSESDLNMLQHLLRQAFAQGGSAAQRAQETYDTCMKVKEV